MGGPKGDGSEGTRGLTVHLTAGLVAAGEHFRVTGGRGACGIPKVRIVGMDVGAHLCTAERRDDDGW
jgi:hypothetical protein